MNGFYTTEETLNVTFGLDPTCADTDRDSVCDVSDNCVDDENPLQDDVDEDDIGDVCDICPYDSENDADGDSYCGDVDNCPSVENPFQRDWDLDGKGDVCDPDDDNDGVLDVNDRCQFSVLPESIPSARLLPNHYADIDGDGYFESVNPRSNLISEDAISFSLTFGCSCEEILVTKPGDTLGEFKFGCTKGTLDVWAAGRGWAR